MGVRIKYIPIGLIITRKNVRRDDDDEIGGLMQSIQDHDLLQPILVRPEGDKYLLIAGHRRLRAVKAAGDPVIPALVRDDITDEMIPVLQLTENIQRKQMRPWELAEVFEEMRSKNSRMTYKRIGAMLGKSEGWVALKFQATKMYEKLLEQGFTEEDCENLTENDLYKMAKIHRTKARAVKRGRKPYEYVGGFEALQVGPRKILIVFRDEARLLQVKKYLEKLKREKQE